MKINEIQISNLQLTRASLDPTSKKTKKISTWKEAQLNSDNTTTVFPPNKHKIKGCRAATPSTIALRPLAKDLNIAKETMLQQRRTHNQDRDLRERKLKKLNHELLLWTS